MNNKVALITGINGQDGSYLAELLLSKGYAVHGIIRRGAIENSEYRLQNILPFIDDLKLHVASLDNQLSVYKIISEINPSECYHLAASSFVSYSLDDEVSIINDNFNSTYNLLSSIKEVSPQCHFYFSGSSEMFGDTDVTPQNELTPFSPRSIYGISKVAGYHLCKNFRHKYGIFACTGIMYNHESPRRGYEFVTRKISSGLARICSGLADHIDLGNIDAHRDWGYSPEYVEVMWRMLNHDHPDDYVVATGQLNSVRDFISLAFAEVGLEYNDYVRINPTYFRPDDEISLVGDCSKAKKQLDWAPKVSFEAIVKEMVQADLKKLKQ